MFVTDATADGKDGFAISVRGIQDVFTVPVRNLGTVFATKVGVDCSVIKILIIVPTTNPVVTAVHASIQDKALTHAVVPQGSQALTVKEKSTIVLISLVLMAALAR